MLKFTTVLFFISFLIINVNAQTNNIDDYLYDVLTTNTVEQECLISFDSEIKIDIERNLKKTEKASLVYSLLKHNATESQREVVQLLHQKNKSFQSYLIANCIHTKLDFELALEISKLKNVKNISFNPTVMLEEPIKEMDQIDLREAEPEWGIKMINADSVWNLGYKGQDVIIGGQDTGFDWDNDVLINKYKGYDAITGTADHNYSWHDAIHVINPLHMDTLVTDSTNPCGLNLIIPCDDHNHGTHTMGTMVGSDTINAIGVAPDSKWIACRNMERGYGSPATYLECFEWFLAPTDLNGDNPDPSKAPHVINNSWSCPEMEGCNESNWSIMEEAVNNLKSAGIVVVVSAGNSGPNCNTVSTPSAIFENSFTVGATASNDSIARFSSRGMVSIDSSFRLKPNVSAPGVAVRSCIRDNQYRAFSGTSMAGPHVAGAVALIISANPELAGRVDIIEDILETTAIPKTDTLNCDGYSSIEVPNPIYGYGRIDVLAAIEQAIQLSSVSDISDNNPFVIFPNPASEQLSITFDIDIKANIQLFDSRGSLMETVKTIGQNQIEMNINDLKAGVYFIMVEMGEHIYYEKFVKVG